MEKSIKTLAICILISSIIVSCVLFYNHYTEMQQSRYYFTHVSGEPPIVFDNKTGQYYYITYEPSGKVQYHMKDVLKMDDVIN